MKKLIALGAAVALFGTSTTHADDYYYCDTGGQGYEECCRASCLAPAVALGTIALVAIIAVAVQNSNCSGNDHAHCN